MFVKDILKKNPKAMKKRPTYLVISFKWFILNIVSPDISGGLFLFREPAGRVFCTVQKLDGISIKVFWEFWEAIKRDIAIIGGISYT